MTDSRQKRRIAGIVLTIAACALLAGGLGALSPGNRTWNAWLGHKASRGSENPRFRSAGREKGKRGNPEVLYRRALERHPELAVTYRDVPDERNGFLKWVEFEKRFAGKSLNLPEDIRAILNGGQWDPERVKQWLAENAALLREIEAMGLTPDQSVKGIEMPNQGFVNARLLKQCTDLLLLQARFQMESGASEEALRSMQAARGMANHMDQIETPILLHETVAMLVRVRSSQDFFDKLLPGMSSDTQELLAWRQVMEPPVMAPSEFGRVLRGEWHVMLRYFFAPQLMPEVVVPDPDRFIDSWANWVASAAQACESATLGGVGQVFADIQATGEGLSPQSEALWKFMFEDASSWSKGWVRCQLLNAQQSAAFAHLLGEPLPNEPITGKPFVWDAAAQSIRFPEDDRLKGIELKPLVIKTSARAQ